METQSWFDVSDIHVVPIQLNFIILNTVFTFIRHEIKVLHSTLNSIEAPNKKPISVIIFNQYFATVRTQFGGCAFVFIKLTKNVLKNPVLSFLRIII